MAAEGRVISGATRGESEPAHRAVRLGLLRRHWAVVAVLAAFGLAALIVPTLMPVAISDDWTYARSAQILLAQGRLTIFPVVVATAIFPIAWGALFGFLLGPTLGVFRLSTVVITALGGLALYGLCRELGVSRPRSALGMAAFLFNPLVFMLAYTFMTDPHFVALLVIATWCFARGLETRSNSSPSARSLTPALSQRTGRGCADVETSSRMAKLLASAPRPAHWARGRGEGSRWERAGVRVYAEGINANWMLAGSVVAALAFLARHQGVLIVVAVVSYLLLSRRLRRDRASILLLARVTAIPLLVIGGYLLWLQSAGSTGAMQTAFLGEVMARGRDGTWWLLRWLTVFEVVYVGFFALPLVVAALPFAGRLARRVGPQGWLFFAIWASIAVVGAGALLARGALMPYVPQFFGTTGLGPPDLLGERPILLGFGERLALTVVCLFATLVFALIAARAMTAPASIERSRAALAAMIGLWQALGIFPPSYHFLGWSAGSVDRYLEPLAPIVIALALWGLRDTPLSLTAGWVVAGLLALFSIAGTRDYLVYMGGVWTLAEQAVAAGVPINRLDGGASWDGYYLYEYSLTHPLPSPPPRGRPWWISLFAPATDAAYVVAGAPLAGEDVVMERSYTPWLDGRPTDLYLLHRPGEPWPP
jgi:hypothetical protein